MFPFFRMFAIFCLTLTGNLLPAQNNIWQPLNGPNGVQAVQSIKADASGRLFMYMNYKIYTSTDNGDSWSECMNGIGQTSGSFQNFLVSPSGDMYVHLEYSGGRLYRYTPASNSWYFISLPFANYDIDGIDFDSQGRLWVSTDESYDVVHYSVNGGQSFQQVTSSGQIQGWFDILATYNDQHNLIAVSYGANQKVYHFNISGVVQQVITGSPVKYLGYNPNTGTAYYSDYDDFKRSADGGLTWQNIIFEPGQTYQSYVQKVTFGPGGKIWAHTSGTMYFSEDDGLTWTEDITLNLADGNYFYTSSGNWFVVNSCGFPNFGRSADGGATWSDLSGQFQQPDVQSILKDAAGNLYARTCRRNAYEKSDDGGQTWKDVVITDSAETFVMSLASRSDGVVMATGANGKYYRSLNNGVSWEEMTSIAQGSFFPAEARFYTDHYGAFYFFEPFGGIVWKSTDSGNSWQALNFWGDFYNPSVAFHPNGDIYSTDGIISSLYIASGDSSTWVHTSDNEPLYDVHIVHCTVNGITYLARFSPFDNYSLYRIAPSGNYIADPVPFFDGTFNLSAIASNAEGDVFVVAGQTIYISENDGITWEVYGEIPGEGYLTTLYMAPDQYMYAGFSGNVIHRSDQPTAESNFVFGKVWLDNDGDCAYDAGEQLQTSVAVTATGNGDYTSFSGYNGNYTLTAPSGAYTLKVQPPNALYEACLTGVPVTLDGPNDSVFADVPLKAVAQCPYLGISLTTPLLRRCFDVTYTVRYKNEGTAPAVNAYVQVTLDSLFIYQSSTLPVATQNGSTYTFNLGDLAPGQSGSFNIVLKVSCEASLGQLHCIAAQIFPSDICLPTLPPIAFYRECRENIGSFDPNDKRAFVDGKEETGYVLPGTDIEYLIRFQNTGTDTAFRVVVEDRLSALLDLSGVTPLVASHPYTMEVRDQRVLRFIFDNILLPDSNINEAASHGFIKFRVSQMPGVVLGSVINNEADIFFDFNAPVRTNLSSLIVGTVSTKPEPGNPYFVAAYPNPFDETVTIQITGPALPGNVTLRLFDALGREARSAGFTGEKYVLHRDELETGLYYFLIESEGKRIGAGKLEAK